MTPYLLIFILLFSLNVNAQTKEQYLNSIYPFIVDSTYSSYYLISNAYQPTFSERDRIAVVQELLKIVSKEKAEELMKEAQTDTLEMLWGCDSLLLAVCTQSTDEIFFREPIIRISSSKVSDDNEAWAREKQIRKAKEEYNQKPEEERRVYHFSRPVLDVEKRLMLIEAGMSCGNLCGFNCMYLFAQSNGQWKLLMKMNCSIT